MISNDQKKYLRSLLHDKGIVIWIGQKGLTDNVSREIEAALDHHELIKIRVRFGNRDEQDALVKAICDEHHAHLIQKTGSIASIYRENPDNPQIRLPE
jgi:RNA-binding protein